MLRSKGAMIRLDISIDGKKCKRLANHPLPLSARSKANLSSAGRFVSQDIQDIVYEGRGSFRLLSICFFRLKLPHFSYTTPWHTNHL
jgi:hypothetical protein